MSKVANERGLPMVVYDCFSAQRFGGNIGGIVLEACGLDTGQMQNIAREINAPVTGFVTGQDGNDVTVRFFMPGAEIPMCGHVTVGLFTYLSGEATDEEFLMKAPAGDVKVHVNTKNDTLPNIMMELLLPVTKPCHVDLGELAQALGLSSFSLSSSAPLEIGSAGLTHLFVHFDSLEEVRALKPDFRKLEEFSNHNGVQTVACFSMETEDPDNTLHVRDFCPALGANEVPASGTTNGALAGYLHRNGLAPDETQTILAEQGIEIGRPSLIHCHIEVAGGELIGLQVGGQAVASIRGTITGF